MTEQSTRLEQNSLGQFYLRIAGTLPDLHVRVEDEGRTFDLYRSGGSGTVFYTVYEHWDKAEIDATLPGYITFPRGLYPTGRNVRVGNHHEHIEGTYYKANVLEYRPDHVIRTQITARWPDAAWFAACREYDHAKRVQAERMLRRAFPEVSR